MIIFIYIIHVWYPILKVKTENCKFATSVNTFGITTVINYYILHVVIDVDDNLKPVYVLHIIFLFCFQIVSFFQINITFHPLLIS